MTHIRAALAFLVAIALAFILPAPAQAVTMQADTQNTTQTNTVVQNNGASNSNTTVQTTVQTHTYTHPRTAPPPKPAPAPPRSTTVFRVDTSRAGTLPVGTSDGAWSQDTHVTLIAQACSGARCIRVQQVNQTACGSDPQIIGCGIRYSDGSCTAQVVGRYSAEVKRAILEHETGHCLGLGHNTSDANSIMQPYLNFNRVPPGPDAIDRANVRAIYP